jgi:hypothetical protein
MTTLWVRLQDSWQRFWFTPQSTAPVEVLRIAFGVLATAWMFSLPPIMAPFFGSQAAVPSPDIPALAWTLMTLAQGTPLIWVLWLAGTIGAVALTVGYKTRLAALLVFVVMVSVTRQAPLAFNAGDGLLRIISFYVLLMPAGSAASVDRWLRDPGGLWTFPRRGLWALRLAQIQLSVVYLATVWEKAGGALWRDGSAVSFAMRIGDITRFSIPSFATDSLLLSQLATHGTLVAEVAIGILVWNRAARPWVLGLGVLLHLSIEVTLAIGFFSLGMITLYLAFLSSERAEQVLRASRDCARRLRGRRRSRGQEPAPASSGSPDPGLAHDAEPDPTSEAARKVGVDAGGER